MNAFYSRMNAILTLALIPIAILSLSISAYARPVATPYICPPYDPDIPGSMQQSDCQALVSFYNDTNGPNWINNAGWLTDAPPCTWFGVSCTGWEPYGYIWQIDLSDNNLAGPISSVGNMPYLHYLKLRFNHLTGDITSLCSHEFYWIGLDGSDLTGSVPACLGNQTELRALLLRGNALSGNIPPELGNMINLAQLWLDDNQLTGEIPPTLGSLTLLDQLYLSGNQLTGSIPAEIGALSHLRQFSLSSNNLDGIIPPELGNLTSLIELSLDNNQITGSLPATLSNLANLSSLGLYHNQLTGNIPPELGNMGSLRYLNLSDNRLTGNIPATFGNLTNLEQLSLGYNKINGLLPSELGNLSNLRQLDLQNNSDLHGPLPDSFLNLALTNFLINGTQLCIPDGQNFDNWLASIPNYIGTLEHCCQVHSVSPMSQTDGRWADDLYDSIPKKIKAKGCYLTALAMALNYASQPETPHTLNEKMKDSANCPGCYGGKGNVVPGLTVQYTSGGLLRFIGSSYYNSSSPVILDKLLCRGPVIVGVNWQFRNGQWGPGHYVLVTGLQNGHYTIIDPNNYQASTLDEFNNKFYIRGVVEAIGSQPISCGTNSIDALPTDAGEMIISLDNQNLMVIDELGRKTGFDAANGKVISEIPSSVYFADSLDDDEVGTPSEDYLASVVIPQPATGTYNVMVTGVQTGTYTLITSSYSPDGVFLPPTIISGYIQAGDVYTYTVQYNLTFSLYLPLMSK